MPSNQHFRNGLIGLGNLGTTGGNRIAANGFAVLGSEDNSAGAEEINHDPFDLRDLPRMPVRPANLPRRYLLLLALILLVSLGLRLYRLGDQGLFSDEAKSWAMTRLTFGEILQISPTQHHVPLYFWLLKAALTVFPSTEAGLRAISLILSMIALVVLLAFLWSEWSGRAALYAGLLMALSSFDVYYAQETRMYTLLSLLSLISYVALVKALQGKPKWLVPWVLACIALPWTHFYGFLTLASQMIIVLIYLLRRQVFDATEGLSRSWLVAAGAAIGVGVLPMAVLLLNRTGTNSQGAVVPELTHIRDLFLLWTVGLVAVREHFLDTARLTWPLTADVSKAGWILLGAALCGAPAVYGMAKAWRMTGTQRVQVSLTLVSIILPVFVVFAYGSLTGQRIWIFRPFLGQGYLVYLWAGIGLASLPQPWLRRGLALAAVIVAIASLGPYFTIWQKSDTPIAMAAAARPDERNLMVVEAPFFGPQASFYLDDGTPLMALYWDQTGAPILTKLQFLDPKRLLDKVQGRPVPVTCDDIAAATDLWIYGNVRRIRNSVAKLPPCVREKRLWVFSKNAWVPLDLPGGPQSSRVEFLPARLTDFVTIGSSTETTIMSNIQTIRIGLIGLGNLGSAIGNLVATKGIPVLGWEYNAAVVEEINRDHTNSRYLPGIALEPALAATTEISAVLESCRIVFIALPSAFIQSTLRPVRQTALADSILVNMAKGIDGETGLTAFQTLTALFPDHPRVMLSGPSIANEFARGMPTVVVLAGENRADLMAVSQVLDTRHFRTRFSEDTIGVELGGLLKNIYAIGLGIFDGKKITSVNFRAAYLTIALEEMSRIGVALGGQRETFAYLAGLGDLLATSLSGESHNRRMGILLSQGLAAQQIKETMGVLPEGYNTLKVILNIAEKLHVSLPLAKALWDVIHGRLEADHFIFSFIRDFVD